MSKQSSSSSKNLISHKSCKSYIDIKPSFKIEEETYNSLCTSDSKKKTLISPKSDLYKTLESYETLFTDPSEGAEFKTKKSKQNSKPDKRNKEYRILKKRIGNECSKHEILNEQDEIIRIQCDIIERLKLKNRNLKKIIQKQEKMLEEMTNSIRDERFERDWIGEQMRIVKEKNKNLIKENNNCIQNYEKIQRRCIELEACVVTMSSDDEKSQEKNFVLNIIIDQYEGIRKENRLLNERCKELSEKFIAMELENKFFKLQENKLNKKIEMLKENRDKKSI
ncbi:hypothetical protein SteCoe_34868 [Stentor coeruleus]|uniref:Uncharacterized protein n=1 Tax=Stentor coeruleus TaxID=5963 RepID=A0A1R2ATX8_9CILI|nr:hypothetical protein SteCoe_34868 [Stentor coeruleus]